MRHTWRWSVLGLLALALATGCGGGGGKKARQSCETDEQCGAGVCFEDQCFEACAADDPCAGGEFCVHREADGSQADVCLVASEFGGCTGDGDCGEMVHDACHLPACGATGVCELQQAEDGTPCGTGGGDQCQAGECVPPVADPCAGKDCDDGNPCTDDACDPQTGCTHQDNTKPCDDGDGCTVGDQCAGGACHPGAAKDCSDADECTVDSCGTDGQCVHQQKDCDDHDPCTVDSCQSGACANVLTPVDVAEVCNQVDDDCDGSTDENGCACEGEVDCDDGNPCTDDGCDPLAGCTHENNTSACEDADPCTLGDHCAGGACQAGAAKECADADPCTVDACDPADGSCSNTLTANDTPEVCNGVDDNCDGFTDEGLLVTLYPDADDDSFGAAGAGEPGCPGTPGKVQAGGDCNDGEPLVNPSMWDVDLAGCGAPAWDQVTATVRNGMDDYRSSPDLVMDGSGRLHLVWSGLMYSYSDDGGAWSSPAVAGPLVGSYPVLALDRQNRVLVAYLTDLYNDLAVGRLDNGAWSSLGTVDPDLYGSGTLDVRSMGLGVDRQGFVHLGYAKVISGTVRAVYATDRSGAWVSTVVDEQAAVGTVTLAMDAAGYPHLAYHTTDGQVRVATPRSGVWDISVAAVDVGTYTGYRLALVVDPRGARHLTFVDPNDGLSLASEKAGAWVHSPISPPGQTVYYLRLAGWEDRLFLAYSLGDGLGGFSLVEGVLTDGSWTHAVLEPHLDDGMGLALTPAGDRFLAWGKFNTAEDAGLRVTSRTFRCDDPGTGADVNCDGVDGVDTDRDGFASGAGFLGGPDCDDNDPEVFPGHEELCNGLDDDCDGGVDEACDADGDTIPDNSDGQGMPGDDPCRGGAATGCDDNCRTLPNPDQADLDQDGVGDACDPDYGT
jgi:hypothetical protein